MNDPLAELRAHEFPELADLAYADYALRGPVPRCARAAVARALDRCALGRSARPTLRLGLERARQRLAARLDAAPHELAWTANTTTAFAALAGSLPWAPGDRVLIPADELPNTRAPFDALTPRGVHVHTLPLRDGLLHLDDVRTELDRGDVTAVVLSAVSLASGQRRDLPALAAAARPAGAALLVDAAQAAGALPISLHHADALAGCSRKWLQGPPELGWLAIRADLAAQLRPLTAGANSFDEGRWRPGALRFEGGVVAEVVAAGLDAALELHERAGAELLQTRAWSRARQLEAGLTAAGWTLRSPTGDQASTLVHAEAPHDLPDEHTWEAAGVVARRVTPRRVRCSPSGWTTAAEIERIVEVLTRTSR